MSQKPSLDFWYEFASPYSYLAAMRIEAEAQKANFDINWKPFLLGPIFRQHGYQDSPFNELPTKRNYMWRDIKRCCQTQGLAFHQPDPFPCNALNAARLALLGVKLGWCPQFTRSVFEAHFGQGKDISDPNILKSILTSVTRDDVERLWDQAQSPDHKNCLRTQTEHAQSLGIFGAPTFMREQEMFWGNDRLEMALTFQPET